MSPSLCIVLSQYAPEQRSQIVGLTGDTLAPVNGLDGNPSTIIPIAASGSQLAVWSASQPVSSQPIRILDTSSGTVSTPSNASDIVPWGLELTDGRLFWLESGESIGSPDLYGCAIDDCAEPTLIASGVGGSITTADGRIYYTDVTDSDGHVFSCSGADAVQGSCTPQTQVSGFEWINARRLHVEGGYVYGINQQWSGLYRAPLE